jgi:hypothetical protein
MPEDLAGTNPHAARAAWAWMLSAGEVKPNDTKAGFHFKSNGFLKSGDIAVAARAQHGKYATEIMLRQHRTHLFTFYISGCWARVFFWDRNGCIASSAVNLNTSPELFQTFIFRLLKLTKIKQGFDNTARLATPEEIAPLREWNPDNKYLREYRDAILTSESLFPIYLVFSCCLRRVSILH